MNYTINYYCNKHFKAYRYGAQNNLTYGGSDKCLDSSMKCDYYSKTYGHCKNIGRNILKTKNKDYTQDL
jgi:hypothetical protein